jgi:hypothetical protein
MEAKMRTVPYLVPNSFNSEMRPTRTGMRPIYPPLVKPKIIEYAMVAAAEEVGNHSAKANVAVHAVHMIMTLNLSQLVLDGKLRSKFISEHSRNDSTKRGTNIQEGNHIVCEIWIDALCNGIASDKRQRTKQRPI